jgi:hypothetical protein
LFLEKIVHLSGQASRLDDSYSCLLKLTSSNAVDGQIERRGKSEERNLPKQT